MKESSYIYESVDVPSLVDSREKIQSYASGLASGYENILILIQRLNQVFLFAQVYLMMPISILDLKDNTFQTWLLSRV